MGNSVAKNKKMDRKQYNFALRQLVARDVKRKYVGSYLGIIWSVLNPLLTMAVMSMIFSTLFKRNIENYPIYYLTGSILWHFFSNATNASMTCIVENKSMLLKVRLSKQTFVIAKTYSALINFGYSLIAYVVMLAVFKIPMNIYMLLFPIAVLFITLFAMGFGFMLSILYVFFGDIRHLYGIVLQLWMYLSAIFYPVAGLNGVMKQIVLINPIYNYIEFARDCVLYAKCPEPRAWISVIGWGVVSFFLGYWIFKANENKVMQNI